jgi:lipopolysaccharide transport system permease protein
MAGRLALSHTTAFQPFVVFSMTQWRYYSRREGFWSPAGWRAMGRELLEARELTFRLFLRDFSARYKQNVLGVFWALVAPVIAVAGFGLLRSSGVLMIGTIDIPYALYAMLGLTIWQVFSGILGASTGALVQAGEMIRKVNFPREALVFGAAGHALVDLLIRIVLVALLFVYFGVTPAWTTVFLPLVVFPLLLASLGMGLILSGLNGVTRDVAELVSVGTSYLLFLTPVLYPRPETGLLATLMAWNPLTPTVEAARGLVLEGRLVNAGGLMWSSLLFLVVFLLCWRMFHLLETLVAERI